MKSLNNAKLNLLEKTSRPVRIVAPYPITYQFKAGSEFVGRSLLEMMHTKFPFRSQDEWRNRIETGRVFLVDRESNPKTILNKSDEIRHYNPAVREPSVPDEVRIIQETENYLVVYKPAPMPMHGGGRYFKNTLQKILEEQGFPELKITHRLDAVTSGVVLFAKDKTFAKLVMEAFTSGLVEKEYHAKVAGIPAEKEKTVESKIRRKHGFVFESGVELNSGMLGKTKFEIIATDTKSNSSLIKCKPITGRTHQIRLHLAEWGFPIIDDPIYGPNGDTSSRRTQNVGISLISVKLKIEALKVDISLSKIL